MNLLNPIGGRAASAGRKKQRGFTLIEIMVVIAILGILAALIVRKIMSRPDEARRVAAKQDIGTVMQALKLYRLDNGRYPSQEQGLLHRRRYNGSGRLADPTNQLPNGCRMRRD